MLKGRHKFEDEDEIYIPDLGDGGFSDDFNLHDRTPRSNAGRLSNSRFLICS